MSTSLYSISFFLFPFVSFLFSRKRVCVFSRLRDLVGCTNGYPGLRVRSSLFFDCLSIHMHRTGLVTGVCLFSDLFFLLLFRVGRGVLIVGVVCIYCVIGRILRIGLPWGFRGGAFVSSVGNWNGHQAVAVISLWPQLPNNLSSPIDGVLFIIVNLICDPPNPSRAQTPMITDPDCERLNIPTTCTECRQAPLTNFNRRLSDSHRSTSCFVFAFVACFVFAYLILSGILRASCFASCLLRALRVCFVLASCLLRSCFVRRVREGAGDA